MKVIIEAKKGNLIDRSIGNVWVHNNKQYVLTCNHSIKAKDSILVINNKGKKYESLFIKSI